jgi:hypothetical protein
MLPSMGDRRMRVIHVNEDLIGKQLRHKGTQQWFSHFGRIVEERLDYRRDIFRRDDFLLGDLFNFFLFLFLLLLNNNP